MAADLPDETEPITILLGADEKQRLEAIAYEASAPGETVSMSHVAREAIRVYIEAAPGDDAGDAADTFETAAQRREEADE